MARLKYWLSLGMFLAVVLAIGAEGKSCAGPVNTPPKETETTAGSSGTAPQKETLTWQTQTLDALGSVGLFPSLGLDTNGKLHISYWDSTYNNLKYATNASGAWNSTTVDSNGTTGAYGSLGLDSQNHLHVAYYDITNRNLKYAYSADTGTNWTRTTIDADGFVGAWCSLAVDHNDKVHISYGDETHGALKYATNLTGTWTTSTVDSGGLVGSETSIAIDTNNKVHIAYFDGLNQVVKYVNNVSGTWTTTVIAPTTTPNTAITIGPNNRVYLAYYDGAKHALKYASDETGAWVVADVDASGDVGPHPSIALDNQGKLHASYYDTAHTSLKYARLNASGQWDIYTVDATGQVGELSSIRIDSNKDVHIAYYDGTNGALKYATTSKAALSPVNTPTISAQPSNLTATAVSSFRIDLTWSDNATNEIGYTIERKTGAGGTYQVIAVLGADTTSYSDLTIADNVTYYYRVKAYNAVGETGYAAAVNTITTLAPPSSLQTNVVSPSRIDLAWTDNSQSETGYRIERKTLATQYLLVATLASNVTTYSDTSVLDGTTYYYRVAALNGGVTSSYSNEASPVIPLNAPTNLAATTISYSRIDLTWTDNSNNETGYKIERKTPATQYSLLATVGLNATNYTDNGVTEGTLYYYRVRAYNPNCNSAYSNEVNALTYPAQVTSPSPANGSTGVITTTQLSWAGASGATSYDVYFGITTTGWTSVTNTALTSYNLGPLTYNTLYYWRIDSKNASGTTTGAVWSFTTQIAPPAQVTSPNPANGSTGVITTTQLSWASVTGATSYDIYFGTSGPGTFMGNQISTTYNLGTLTYNTLYYWRINSKNASGTTVGNLWTFTTQIAPPAQVTSPTPANGVTNILITHPLSWAAASGATSYDVYFSTINPPAYVTNTTSTIYQPVGLTYTMTYYWRIDACNSGGVTTGTVWSFTTIIPQSNWTFRSPPPARYGQALAYDSVRQKTMFFGGAGGSGSLNDTWEWDGMNWTQRFPATVPPSRYNHAIAYDSVRKVTVLFGGFDPVPGYLNDTWEWDGTNWTQRFGSITPTARWDCALVYDSVHQKTVLFGGANGVNYLNDTWEWDGTNWTQRSPATSPSGRREHALAYDSVRQKTVLFGGYNGSYPYLNDTWEWDGTNWTQRSPANNPSIRKGHAMAYNSVRQKTVLFGGYNGSSYLNDTWEWDGTNWTQRFDTITPTARSGCVLAYDSQRQKTVLFGGYNGSYFNDTWEWDGANWTQRFGTVTPTARAYHTLAYDSVRQRTVLFGGWNGFINGGSFFNDTWEWDGVNWTQQFGTVTPTARAYHALAYDSVRQKTVLFGGFNGGYANDTWEYGY